MRQVGVGNMEHTHNAKTWEKARNSITNTKHNATNIRTSRNQMARVWTHPEKNYSLYYSCNPHSTGHLGTGFLVKKEIEKIILDFEPYNGQICKLRINRKYHNLSLICVLLLQKTLITQ
jgi:hypothetical protein